MSEDDATPTDAATMEKAASRKKKAPAKQTKVKEPTKSVKSKNPTSKNVKHVSDANIAKARFTHPVYVEMIKEGIKTLKERAGSSRHALLKYIMTNFQVGGDEKQINSRIKLALKGGVEIGLFNQVKGTGANGSFKLSTGNKVLKVADEVEHTKPAKATQAKPKKVDAIAKSAKPVSKLTKANAMKKIGDASVAASTSVTARARKTVKPKVTNAVVTKKSKSVINSQPPPEAVASKSKAIPKKKAAAKQGAATNKEKTVKKEVAAVKKIASVEKIVTDRKKVLPKNSTKATKKAK